MRREVDIASGYIRGSGSVTVCPLGYLRIDSWLRGRGTAPCIGLHRARLTSIAGAFIMHGRFDYR